MCHLVSWVWPCSVPCKFSSRDSFQKRLLWTHKKVDLAVHLVVGLVPASGKCREVSSGHLISKAGILFFRVNKQGPCFTASDVFFFLDHSSGNSGSLQQNGHALQVVQAAKKKKKLPHH